MPQLRDVIRPTTFIESKPLNNALGLDITIATETFQHTGSFKFRAAYNLVSSAPNDRFLTASSGNFGQALAYACKLLKKRCTVVMPETSAKVKIEAVRAFDAELVLIDTNTIGRNERVGELAREMTDAYIASAYDDDAVIEGNASLGEELAERDFDAVICPVGGGGLISGIIKGLSRRDSHAGVYAAEPFVANDGARSFRSGALIPNDKEPKTIADGARTISLGERNWEIIRKGVRGFFEVTEDAIERAVRVYFELANLKCEPTAALPLGALFEHGTMFENRRVCLVVSGGNVDPDVYARILSEAPMIPPAPALP